jgi:hypothetical protein
MIRNQVIDLTSDSDEQFQSIQRYYQVTHNIKRQIQIYKSMNDNEPINLEGRYNA